MKLLEYLNELKQIESSINPKLPCRSEEAWSKFFKWIDGELCNEDSGEKLSEKVGVAKQQVSVATNMNEAQAQAREHDQGGEYALIAKVPFKLDQKVFSIGRKIMLTTETATKDVDLFDFIKRDQIASGMQNVVLVLHLLNEHSKQERSYWWPYLSILPSKLLPILDLDKDKLKYLLASSHVFEALKMIRAIARQHSYFYKRLQSTKLPLRRNFTFAYYAWGVSVVCSRQNEIPIFDRQACASPVIHALIPILDMCNHNRHSNQATFENDHSCLVVSNDLEPDAEITINYGIRSSGEFYIHNGFVPDEIPNDLVPLTIVLNKQDALLESRSKLLKILNMPAFGRFRLIYNNQESRHKRDPHLTMFLIVNFLTGEELDLILTSSNPVGVADEIYEFVQYGESVGVSRESAGKTNNGNGFASNGNDSAGAVDAMRRRLSGCVKDYLSRRSSVSVALIDRALSDGTGSASSDEGTHYARELLKRERSVYESHMRTEEAK